MVGELTNFTILMFRKMCKKTLCLPIGLLVFGLLDLFAIEEDRLTLLRSSTSNQVFFFGLMLQCLAPLLHYQACVVATRVHNSVCL